jgi:multiple sugar transport system substrate-binding protein
LEYADGNQLLDLSEVKTDKEFNYGDIFPTSSGALTKNDKIYGIPFSSAPRMIFFNKTLFKEKGIKNPLDQAKAGEWTYDNYLKTATAMNDPAKGIYGTSLVMILGWKSWMQNYLDTIWAFGGQILSDDGTKFLLNSPEGEKALQFIADLIFKYQVHPKPGDQIAFSFETGKLAMSRQDFSYINNARKIKDFEWDIAPMPTNIASALNSVGNPGYAIFKETKHPKEALAFLKFMSGADGSLQLADLFVAPRKSLLESDVFQKSGTSPSAEGIKYALTEVFTKGVRTEYTHKNMTEIDLKMQRALDRLYTKEDVKTVLKIMEEEITPLLK